MAITNQYVDMYTDPYTLLSDSINVQYVIM